MKKQLLMTLTLLPALAWASVPTVEGLFRNAHNSEIEGNTAAVSFSLEAVEKSQDEQQQILMPIRPVEDKDEQAAQRERLRGYYKLIFSLEENRPTPMLQVRYNSRGLDPSQVNDVLVIPNIERQVRAEKVLEKQFLYSMVLMFGLNDSSGFDALFSKITPDYKSNKDLISPEKKYLYDRYKKYLKQVKEEPSLKEELENPMRPEDEEAKKEIAKLRGERFYKDDGKVRLIKQQGSFFWEVSMEMVSAVFTQEEHRMTSMQINTLQGVIEVHVSDYILMSGSHELPQKIIIDHPEYGRYEMKFLGVQDFESEKTSFNDRVKEYRGYLERNSKSSAQKDDYVSLPYTY